jgi:hypothetical protein
VRLARARHAVREHRRVVAAQAVVHDGAAHHCSQRARSTPSLWLDTLHLSRLHACMHGHESTAV